MRAFLSFFGLFGVLKPIRRAMNRRSYGVTGSHRYLVPTHSRCCCAYLSGLPTSASFLIRGFARFESSERAVLSGASANQPSAGCFPTGFWVVCRTLGFAHLTLSPRFGV